MSLFITDDFFWSQLKNFAKIHDVLQCQLQALPHNNLAIPQLAVHLHSLAQPQQLQQQVQFNYALFQSRQSAPDCGICRLFCGCLEQHCHNILSMSETVNIATGLQAASCNSIPATPSQCFVAGTAVGATCGLTTANQVGFYSKKLSMNLDG